MNKKEIVGVLDPAFDWNSRSPDESLRIFFLNNPDAAVQRVRQLEGFNKRLLDIAHETLQLALLGTPATTKAAIRTKILQRLEAQRESIEALSPPAGLAAVKARAKSFEESVRERIKASHPGCKTRHIVAEIVQLIEMDNNRIKKTIQEGGRWEQVDDLKFARRDKQGRPYSKHTVEDKVSPD